MHAFFHCLSSQNYIAKLGSYRFESTFFWLLNQVSLEIIWNYRTKNPRRRPHFWPCPTWSWLWCFCYSCYAERRVGRGRDPRRCFMFLGMQLLRVLRRRFKNRWCNPTCTSLNWTRKIVIQQWMNTKAFRQDPRIHIIQGALSTLYLICILRKSILGYAERTTPSRWRSSSASPLRCKPWARSPC